MTTDYRIAYYTDEDHEALLRFFRESWTPPPYKKSASWLEWLLHANPGARDGNLPLLLAWHGERIIGMLMLMPTTLWHGDSRHRVSWGRDLFVDPEHRRNKIALKLNDVWFRDFDAALVSGQSDMSRAKLEKYAWTVVGPVKQWEKLFPDIRLLRRTRQDSLRKLARQAGAMAYGSAMGLFNQPGKSRTVREVSSFPDDVDELWRTVRSCAHFICSRDSASLRWRFEKHPYSRYRIFEARNSARTLMGYLVTRSDGDTGMIIDHLCGPDDRETGLSLIQTAGAILKAGGVRRMVFRGLCAPLERLLRSAGYLQTVFEQRVFLKSLQEFPAGEPVQWHITAGDSDLDR